MGWQKDGLKNEPNGKRDSLHLQSSPRKNTLYISESNNWKHFPWGKLVKHPSTASSELIDSLRTKPLDQFFWSDINAITAFCSSRNRENHSENAGNRIPRTALIPAWWVSFSKMILRPSEHYIPGWMRGRGRGAWIHCDMKPPNLEATLFLDVSISFVCSALGQMFK